jgi:hypothetical protein
MIEWIWYYLGRFREWWKIPPPEPCSSDTTHNWNKWNEPSAGRSRKSPTLGLDEAWENCTVQIRRCKDCNKQEIRVAA